MKIKRIHLARFRGFENLEIQLPEKAQSLVFIGENGCGKTSLMDALAMILQDRMQAHHDLGTPDWANERNVHHANRYGSVEITLKGHKRTYEFSQTLTASRTRFISEERLALDLGRDLTDEDRFVHYLSQAKMALTEKKFQKTIEFLEKTLKYSTNLISTNNKYELYNILGLSYYEMHDYSSALQNFQKIKDIENSLNRARLLSYIGLCNVGLKNYEAAARNYKEELELVRNYLDDDSNRLSDDYSTFDYIRTLRLVILLELRDALGDIKSYSNYFELLKKVIKDENDIKLVGDAYNVLSSFYELIGEYGEMTCYEEKIKSLGLDANQQVTPPLDDLAPFQEYLEVWTPLVLQYTAKTHSSEEHKEAKPVAFGIPMTTDFEMIADWFTEHENDENRKRLRLSSEYRSEELRVIREVIVRGLEILHEKENHFTELQTEINETVKDGQISSWLSIRKEGVRLHVNQLSDGEKRVLVLLVDIARRLITVGKLNKSTDYLNGAGVVLIDEIEQHLHPKWQRNILPALTTLFPNVQFIVATHSPQVLSRVPNGCTFALENGKAYPQNTYGRDNEWILEAIMDDVSRPKEMQALLYKYFDLIKEDRLEEAAVLRKELEEKIGADEPELLRADILLRRKVKNTAKNEAN